MFVGIFLVLFVVVTVWFWSRVGLRLLAKRAFDAGDYDRALRILKWALRLQKQDSITYYTRGVVYWHMGDFNSAMKDFTEALYYNPRNTYALLGRAMFFQQVHRDEEALEAFNEALELEPYSIDLLVRRAWVFVKLGQLDRAMEDCDRTMEQVLIRLERRKNARFGLRRLGMAEVINQQCVVAYELQGGLFSRRGRYDDSLASYARAIECQPENAGLYGDRAAAHLAAEQYQAALGDLAQAETIITEDPARNVVTMSGHRISEYITMYRAIAYHAQERIEESVVLWRTLLAIDEGYGHAGWLADEFIWQDTLLEEAYTIIVRLGVE
jgi:tetratricopeptide (TPR) repeat protein